jgi:hypothetical protein
MSLKSFTKKVADFPNLSASARIDYFIYFLLFHENMDGIKAPDLLGCFSDLDLVPYSNIPAYLATHAKRGKGQKYLKRQDKYFLENTVKNKIQQEVETEPMIDPSNNLYPLSIFDNTRGYLIAFSREASACYDYGLYNSCFFMIRKILETVIIELFERHNIESKIKSASGGYLFLSDLITKLVAENTWHLTKITREDIPKIKKLADSSVHSKRFSAKKNDIDNIKTELRIILQELINHVDYPTWSKS